MTIDPPPETPESPAGLPESPRTFSLASLLLLTTLTAFLLGVGKWNAGVGVTLVILAIPAYGRTIMVVNRRKALGKAPLGWEKLAIYGRAFGEVVVIAGSTAAIFLAIASLPFWNVPSTFDEVGTLLAFGLALGISGFVGASFILRLWGPKR